MDISIILKPKGRLNRLNHFLFLYVYPTIIIFTIIGFIFLVPEIALPLLFIIYIFTLYILIIGSINRLHDLNKSGWLVLLWIVPFINLGLMIYLLFFKGTEGENRFGPDPLGSGNLGKKDEVKAEKVNESKVEL